MWRIASRRSSRFPRTCRLHSVNFRRVSTDNCQVHALTDWYPYEKKLLERIATKHRFSSRLWLSEDDANFTFPTDAGWDTVRIKPSAKGFFSSRIGGTETLDGGPTDSFFQRYFIAQQYFSVEQAVNADAIAAYHKERIPTCISRRIGFDTAVQVKLHEHARKHDLRSRFWFTPKTLQKLYGDRVRVSPEAEGVSFAVKSYTGEPTTSVLFNGDQTNDAALIHRRALRGHMTNFHSGAKFHAEYQDALHTYAEANGLHGNLWIDQKTLQRVFPDVAHNPNAIGIELELHRSEVAVRHLYYNIDEIVNKEAVLKAFDESNAMTRCRNFRTGAAYTFRSQKILHETARQRQFKSPYWVDVEDMRKFHPPLELTEHDDGVYIEENNGKRKTMYNMDQIRNSKLIIAAYNKRSSK